MVASSAGLRIYDYSLFANAFVICFYEVSAVEIKGAVFSTKSGSRNECCSKGVLRWSQAPVRAMVLPLREA
jgi:hypothetical protein